MYDNTYIISLKFSYFSLSHCIGLVINAMLNGSDGEMCFCLVSGFKGNISRVMPVIEYKVAIHIDTLFLLC